MSVILGVEGELLGTHTQQKSKHSTSLPKRCIYQYSCVMLFSFINHLCLQAESRLAARRQARAEAREIRMKELEKQQKEMDENADRQYEASG